MPQRKSKISDLKKLWERRCKIDPFIGCYDRGKKIIFSNESLSGGDIAEALDFLADMLGDEAFRTARLALDAYGLGFGGGLKQKTLSILDEQGQTAAWGAMPKMHSLVKSGTSAREAAEITVANLGIPGTSFDSTTSRLRKETYSDWLESIQRDEPRKVNHGDTGRKLRIRFARPWLGVDNKPINELMGIKFDDDGFGLAPDNREWRRLIHAGHIALYGTIELGKSSPE